MGEKLLWAELKTFGAFFLNRLPDKLESSLSLQSECLVECGTVGIGLEVLRQQELEHIAIALMTLSNNSRDKRTAVFTDRRIKLGAALYK